MDDKSLDALAALAERALPKHCPKRIRVLKWENALDVPIETERAFANAFSPDVALALIAELRALRAALSVERWHSGGNIGPFGQPWPARCLNCDLVTEDPDAFFMPPGGDEEVVDERYLCPFVGTNGLHEIDERIRCRDCGTLLSGKCTDVPRETERWTDLGVSEGLSEEVTP